MIKELIKRRWKESQLNLAVETTMNGAPVTVRVRKLPGFPVRATLERAGYKPEPVTIETAYRIINGDHPDQQ